MTSPPAPKLALRDMLLSFFMPVLAGKIMVLVSGALYARYPGEGYGWWLVFSILFTLAGVARFLWRYRHHED